MDESNIWRCRYTVKTLQFLNSKVLMPEMVQIGNEINCGMFFTNTPAGFPMVNACNGNWKQLGEILNAGIKAVREAAASSFIKPKILLHIADPKNVEWWFDHIISEGKLTDFDVIGFSYYPLWHSTITLEKIATQISLFKKKYHKMVMILETAYPWTTNGNDNYTNVFGSQPPLPGYAFSQQGLYAFMKTLTQAVIDGGGSGVIYWEPVLHGKMLLFLTSMAM